MIQHLTLSLLLFACLSLQAQQQTANFTLLENYSFDCISSYTSSSAWWNRLREHNTRDHRSISLNFLYNTSLQRYNRELNYTIEVKGAQVQYSPNYRLFPTLQLIAPREVCLKVELYRQTDNKVLERKWLSSSTYATYYSGGEASLRYTYRDTMENASYELRIIQSEWSFNLSSYALESQLDYIDEYYKAAEQIEKIQLRLQNLPSQPQSKDLEQMEEALSKAATLLKETQEKRFWSELNLNQLDALDPLGLRGRLQNLQQYRQQQQKQYDYWVEKLPELYYQEAQNAYARGDNQEAERKAERASKERPSYASPQLLLARMAMDDKKINDFKQYLQQALNSCQPNYAEQQEAQNLSNAYFYKIESEIRENMRKEEFTYAKERCQEAQDWFKTLRYINTQQNAFDQLRKEIHADHIKFVEKNFQNNLQQGQTLFQQANRAFEDKNWEEAQKSLNSIKKNLYQLERLGNFQGANINLLAYLEQEKAWIELQDKTNREQLQSLVADKKWELAYDHCESGKRFAKEYQRDLSFWQNQIPNIVEQNLQIIFDVAKQRLLSKDRKETDLGVVHIAVSFSICLRNTEMPLSAERKAAWQKKVAGILLTYLSETVEYQELTDADALKNWIEQRMKLVERYQLNHEPAVLQTFQKAEQHRCKLSNTAIAQREQQLEQNLQNRQFTQAFEQLQSIKKLVLQEQNCPPDISHLLAKEAMLKELKDYETDLAKLQKAEKDKSYDKAFSTLIRLHQYHQKAELQTHLKSYPYANWQQYVEQQNQAEYSYQASLYLGTTGDLENSFRYLKNALIQDLDPKKSQSLQERLGFELGKKDYAPKASRSKKLSERIGGMEKKFKTFEKAYAKGWKAAK